MPGGFSMSSSQRSRSRRFKRWLANAFVALLAVVALLLLVGLFLPRSYSVVRVLEIQARPAAIFADLNDLRRWPEWTVWNQEMDPTVQFTFESPETGVGAVYRWKGQKLGQGELKLTEASLTNGIAYDLSFEEGRYRSTGSIRLEEMGGAVRVSWQNGGDLGKSPINRYAGLFMDSMLGPDLEQGLARLKVRAEGGVK